MKFSWTKVIIEVLKLAITILGAGTGSYVALTSM